MSQKEAMNQHMAMLYSRFKGNLPWHLRVSHFQIQTYFNDLKFS